MNVRGVSGIIPKCYPNYSCFPKKTDKKSRTKKSQGDESESQSVTSNLATTLRNRYSSSDYARVRERPRPLPNPADEWDENGDLTDKRR